MPPSHFNTPPRWNRGGTFTCRRPAAKDGARPFFPGLPTLLCVVSTVGFALSGCAEGGANPTPFTSASHPQAGKIPVSVTAGVDATGNSADPRQGVAYTAGAHVTFGHGVRPRRVAPGYGPYPDITGAFVHSPFTPAEQRRFLLDDQMRAGHEAAQSSGPGGGAFPDFRDPRSNP